jgi:hypothetical protein
MEGCGDAGLLLASQFAFSLYMARFYSAVK